MWGRVGEKEWECEERKAKLPEEEGGGERKKEMLLRVLDGNFSNEKTMTALWFGLQSYESQQILTPECSQLLLTQGEQQKERLAMSI